MEKWLLVALEYKLHPVTPLDGIHLLLPYVDLPEGCGPREHKRSLFEQYVENISLAQSLVYPLLKYPQIILAISAVICGAHLISGRSGVGTGGGKGKPPPTMEAHEQLKWLDTAPAAATAAQRPDSVFHGRCVWRPLAGRALCVYRLCVGRRAVLKTKAKF